MISKLIKWLIILQLIGGVSLLQAEDRGNSRKPIKRHSNRVEIGNKFNLKTFNKKEMQKSIEAGHREFHLRLKDKIKGERPKITSHREGQEKITLKATDPKSGEVTTFEVPLDKEQANKESPEALRQYIEQIREQTGKKIDPIEQVRHFSMESFSFYYGVGLHAVYNLITEAHSNPNALSQAIDSLDDPITHISFAAFIIGNHSGNKALNSILLDFLDKGRISERGFARLSQMVVPHLSMAVGGMLSNVSHDVAILLKQCANKKFTLGTRVKTKQETESTQVCQKAFEDVLNEEKFYQYVTMISSMVVSSFTIAGMQMGLRAIGNPAVKIKGIALPLIKSAFGLVAVPQLKLKIAATWAGKAFHFLKNFHKKAFHLVLFFEVDQEIFHPLFSYNIQKLLYSGKHMMDYQSELTTRLEQTRAKRMSNNLDIIHLGSPNTPRPLTPLEKTWDNTIGILMPKTKYETQLYGKEEESLEELLKNYNEYTKKWRKQIMHSFEMAYYNWLETIAPFNSNINTTREFYKGFFNSLETADNFRKPYDELYEKHPLIHEDILGNIEMRSESGEMVSNENITVAQQELYRLNSLKFGICPIKTLYQMLKSQEDHRLSRSRTKAKGWLQSELLINNFEGILKNLSFLNNEVNCTADEEETLEAALRFMISYSDQRTGQDASLVMAEVANITNDRKTISKDEKQKIRNALTYLNLIYEKLRKESVTLGIEKQNQFLMTFNMLIHFISAYGDVMPLDPGEYFLISASEHFLTKEERYAKRFSEAPAFHLIHQMACSKKESAYYYEGWQKFMGNIIFQPPRVVDTIDSEVCNERIPESFNDLSYAMLKVDTNISPTKHINYIAQHTKDEIFKSGKSDFPIWWSQNISPQIDEAFVKLNNLYKDAVYEELVPKIFENEDSWLDKLGSITTPSLMIQLNNWSNNRESPPDDLMTSYILPINLYMNFLGKIYSQIKGPIAEKQWADLQFDLQLSLSELMSLYKKKINELNGFNDKYTNKESREYQKKYDELMEKYSQELATRYAKVLAIYKKAKSLFLHSSFENQNLDAFEEENLSFYRRHLNKENPDLLRWEHLNKLEARVEDAGDNYINEKFREQIGIIGASYKDMIPLVFKENVEGHGLESVELLLDSLMDTIEDAYSISKMVDLAGETIYTSTEIKEKGPEAQSSVPWLRNK